MTQPTDPTPRLARIAIHPIKSLDPTRVEATRIVANGGLAHDREYAVVDEAGEYVNGKQTAAVHRIRARFEDGAGAVVLRRQGDPEAEARRFTLEGDRDRLSGWLGDQFGVPVRVTRNADGGFPDDEALSGPTVISTGTLREVASWFPEIGVDGMRRRLRANLEIGGVPAFWEDRLFAGPDSAVAFRIGDAILRGVNPCQRCVVPTRDPWTGEHEAGFRETFVENRKRTLPPWADRARFDHYFRLMVNTEVPPSEWGTELAVGDEVTVLGERPR